MAPPSLESIRTELQKHGSQSEILAVSKFQSEAKIRDLYRQGQRKFAENYVQEALEKQKNLSDLEIEWHFIGHLQKNKVKQVVGKFSLIHSVDSLELAQVIDRKAAELGVVQDILLQLNLAGEASKGGFSAEEFEAVLPTASSLKSVRVMGLMTMPPLFEDPELARPFFQKLSNIRDQFLPLLPNLNLLSMGTSSDYLVAAEEGASLARLGTILFGERPAR